MPSEPVVQDSKNVLLKYAVEMPITDARTPRPISSGAVRIATSTGALTVCLLAFAATKSGDSSTFARITRPTMTRMADSRNGTRHPHVRN